MLLTFPDLDTLHLAITSQAVPDMVCRAAVQAVFEEDGRVLLSTEANISKTTETALKRLKVQVHKENSLAVAVSSDHPTLDFLSEDGDEPRYAPNVESLLCWPQILPLVRDEGGDDAQKRPVLFELSDDAQLTEIVTEILRLGNDRQAFRWLNDGAHCRALLRVIEPPYYTLLRALDQRRNGSARDPQDDAVRPPRAYVERGDRVWVEFGWNHPLAAKLKPPAGKLLLMRPLREWLMIDEGRFQDVYSALEFILPEALGHWQSHEQQTRIAVPLKLASSDSTDPAELWVLSGTGVEQLDDLVKNGDDQLLARLSFAVAQRGTESTTIVRARPGKTPPPVLVLDGTAYRPYLKLPNLFVPCTARLHPPLRRDAVKNLLAEDSLQVVWLQPTTAGNFVPQSLPDEAFRPLPDWVDYVLDREQEPLTAWQESMQFDFESFVCHEPSPDKAKPRPKKFAEDLIEEPVETENEVQPEVATKVKLTRAKSPTPETEELPVPIRKPNDLRVKLRELESKFQQLPSPLNAGKEHLVMWAWMAQLNAALSRDNDAAVCAGNALWDAEAAAPSEKFWTWHRQHPAIRPDLEWTAERLDELLTDPTPPLTAINGLIAFLAWSLFAGKMPPQIPERLPRIQQFVEAHEHLIGVRLAWVAWLAIFKASQKDVLTLARARDRLLERLFQQGLSPEVDLPSFLRFSGQPQGDRFRSARDSVIQVREFVAKWLTYNGSAPGSFTAAYTDLMFAYALARLGENAESQNLEQRASAVLLKKDPVHRWLAQAFGYRIAQSREGQGGGQFPDDLLSKLESFDRTPRYVVDRLRERSRILEPHEKFDPYRNWRRLTDDLSRELASLCDIPDRAHLQARLEALLRRSTLTPLQEAGVLETALDLSPRLGEVFAAKVLERLPGFLDNKPPLLKQMELLEKGLFVAAHFDHPAHVQEFVRRFRGVIESDTSPDFEKALAKVLEKSFHGLRKLGMRDDIAKLLELISDRVRKFPLKPSAPDETRASQLKLLLQIAAGWFYFSQDDKARSILDEARTMLLEGELIPVFQTDLAAAYLTTLGNAPVEFGVNRMIELFRGLERVTDTFTTSSHYKRSQLGVVEATVLALVSDDFTIDKSARRWLDDDEYLVRRKIHADVRATVGAAQP